MPLWMSTAEIAERTGLSSRYVRDEIRSGRIPAFKFGRRGGHGTYRVPKSKGEDYIREVLGQFYC